MTALEPHEILRQVLEIIDLFEDENMRMAGDTVLINPKARCVSKPADLEKHYTAETHMHVAMNHAARMIGDAIRAKFDLPAKED